MSVVYERRGSGSPLVLVHGIGHRWQGWEPVLDQLARHHDVIAMDMPGFGRSDPPGGDRPYDMELATELVADMFTEWGIERPHVAGNSLGGTIALELAARGLARSVTALAPGGFWRRDWERASSLKLLEVIRSSGKLPGPVRRAVARHQLLRIPAAGLLFGKPGRVSEQMLLDDLEALANAPSYRSVATEARRYTFSSPEPSVPTTVAWGDRDLVLFPWQAKVAERLLPSAEHVRMRGCGHLQMNDAPELVARTILDTCRRVDSPTHSA